MIERHITFQVPDEGVAAFQAFFDNKYVPPMSEVDGFVSARLLRPADRSGEVLMVLQFEHAEASAAWRESDAHAALQPELGSLNAGMAIQGYESL